MFGRLFHEAGTPKDSLTFSQVQQSFHCKSCMFSSYSITSSRPGKRSFLPKWLTNSIRSLFDAHLSIEGMPARVGSWDTKMSEGMVVRRDDLEDPQM